MNRNKETYCFWCKKPMLQRIDTYKRQVKLYGHNCCKRCFGNEQSFKNARRLIMLSTNPFKGRRHNDTTRAILSNKAMGRTPWNKGIRKQKAPVIPGSINRWMAFKREIMTRDFSTCWKCGGKNRIEVHHIISKKRHPEFHYDESNCITLCYWCHKAFHKLYSRYTFEGYHTTEWLNIDRSLEDRVIFC